MNEIAKAQITETILALDKAGYEPLLVDYMGDEYVIPESIDDTVQLVMDTPTHMKMCIVHFAKKDKCHWFSVIPENGPEAIYNYSTDPEFEEIILSVIETYELA